MDIGLLLIRLVCGLTVARHGAQKLFGWFGGRGIAGTGKVIEGVGFFPGRPYAALAGGAEFGAGLALALGIGTPFASAIIVTIALIAIAFDPSGASPLLLGADEYYVVLGCSALALAFSGAGYFSLDAVLSFESDAWGFGVGAFSVAVAATLCAIVLKSESAG